MRRPAANAGPKGRQGIARRAQALRASEMMGSASSPELTWPDLQADKLCPPGWRGAFPWGSLSLHLKTLSARPTSPPRLAVAAFSRTTCAAFESAEQIFLCGEAAPKPAPRAALRAAIKNQQFLEQARQALASVIGSSVPVARPRRVSRPLGPVGHAGHGDLNRCSPGFCPSPLCRYWPHSGSLVLPSQANVANCHGGVDNRA